MMNQRNHDFDDLAEKILSMYKPEDMYALVASMVYQLGQKSPTLDTKWSDYCLAHYGMCDDALKMKKSISFGQIYEASKKPGDIMQIIAPGKSDVSPVWGTACLATLHEIIHKKPNFISRMIEKLGMHFAK